MPTFSLVNYDRFYVMKTHPRDYDFSLLLKEVNLIIEYLEYWLKFQLHDDDIDHSDEFLEEVVDIKNRYLPTLEIIRTFIITSEVIHVKNINFLKFIVFHITKGYDTGYHDIFITQKENGKYFMKKDNYEYEYEEEEEEEEERAIRNKRYGE
jgi:hypothetical protein